MKVIFIIALIILVFVFTLKMAIHVFSSKMSSTAKAIWITGMLLAPFLGATLYYISDYNKY